MQRRSFLGLAAAGAAASSLSFRAPLPGGRLADAVARATANGKPLLVLVVPEDDERAARSGRAFGRFLRFATDAHLALLATCDFVCAPAKEVAAHTRLRVAGDAWAVLVEIDGESSHRVLSADDIPFEGHDQHAAADAIGNALRTLLYPDEATSLRRMTQNQAVIGGALRGSIDFYDTSARPRSPDVDAAGPILYQRSIAIPAQRDMWLERLAYAAAARLWDSDPDGATWEVDPDASQRPDPCPPCGMAICPEPSRTFLQYYTK